MCVVIYAPGHDPCVPLSTMRKYLHTSMPCIKVCNFAPLPLLDEQLQVLNGRLELSQPVQSLAMAAALLHMQSCSHACTGALGMRLPVSASRQLQGLWITSAIE